MVSSPVREKRISISPAGKPQTNGKPHPVQIVSHVISREEIGASRPEVSEY
jgi:hypothetical protein